jgi:hypothetical protein
VVACICLAAGMRPEDPSRKFALFGLILGIGYWTKSILFPLGFVILSAGYWWKRSAPGWWHGCGGLGLSVHVRAIDLPAFQREGAVHFRRFGQSELCVVMSRRARFGGIGREKL